MLKAINLSFLLSVHVMHELGKQQTIFSASSLLKVSRSLRVPVKAEVVYVWPWQISKAARAVGSNRSPACSASPRLLAALWGSVLNRCRPAERSKSDRVIYWPHVPFRRPEQILKLFFSKVALHSPEMGGKPVGCKFYLSVNWEITAGVCVGLFLKASIPI